MRRSHLGLASLAFFAFLAFLVSPFALLAGCGGTSDVTIPGTNGDAGSTAMDGSVPPSEGGPIKDATPSSDATDPPKDAGVVVTEEPSPDCHDLKQVGMLVTPTTTTSDPPLPLPLASIPPGRYVVKEVTYYGMISSIAPQRITAFFTGTREYYIAGSGAQSTVATLDYKIANGVISRTIVCPENANSVADAHVGGSANGFTLYFAQGNDTGNTTETVRYELAN